MLFIALWCYILFFCWNHTLYKAYAKLTWSTLLHEMKPKEWRDYKIDESLQTHQGWIL